MAVVSLPCHHLQDIRSRNVHDLDLYNWNSNTYVHYIYITFCETMALGLPHGLDMNLRPSKTGHGREPLCRRIRIG